MVTVVNDSKMYHTCVNQIIHFLILVRRIVEARIAFALRLGIFRYYYISSLLSGVASPFKEFFGSFKFLSF